LCLTPLDDVRPLYIKEALVADELPLRASENIQGNVLAAFNKDHMTFLLLDFTDSEGAREWLKEIHRRVTTTKEVEDFNTEFSNARRARGGEDPPMKAVWVNVGLTIDGLEALASDFGGLDADLRNLSGDDQWPGFADFRAKPAARAEDLGDTGRSAPENWVFGGPGQPDVDAVVTVAADEPEDLETRLGEIQRRAARHGVTTIFRLDGNTLPGKRKGHEHFGFKDGISQPGVRQFHPTTPEGEERLNHPGTKMVHPGEFVLGYPDEHGRPHEDIPEWMKDGSFQVLRRLAQDVPGWWAQMRQARDLENFEGGEDRLAAKTVGRWRSGSPLAHTPDHDDLSARDPDKINNFEFEPDDPDGEKTPRFSHIRKTYPRTQRFNEAQHRIMRRGIPFGLHFDPALGRGHGQDAERGLIFNAHCADLEAQFEFIQQSWANNRRFPFKEDGSGPDPGPDPVIGTDGKGTLHEKGADQQLDFMRFVHTTGALYAFAPSKRTLQLLANGDL
jgi:Dyp-type peroxidase family